MKETEFYLNNRLYTTHYHAKSDIYTIFIPPLFEELARTRRFMVNLARQVAADGINVLRFDYYGTGLSYGQFDELTLEILSSDVNSIVDYCKREGAGDITLLGARLGAFLALKQLTTRDYVSKVILLEPVINLSSYIDDILKLAIMNQIVIYGSVKVNVKQLIEKLNRGENIFSDGYSLSSKLFTDFKNAQLLEKDLAQFKDKITIINWRSKEWNNSFRKLNSVVLNMDGERFSYNNIKYIENKSDRLFGYVRNVLRNETYPV